MSVVADPARDAHWPGGTPVGLRARDRRALATPALLGALPRGSRRGRRSGVHRGRGAPGPPRSVDRPVLGHPPNAQYPSELNPEFGLTYLFIAHDLDVVRHVADRVAVMYLGRPSSSRPPTSLNTHPRTVHRGAAGCGLVVPPVESGARHRHGRREILAGDVPSPISPSRGVPFSPPVPVCDRDLRRGGALARRPWAGRLAACHHPLDAGRGPAGRSPRR